MSDVSTNEFGDRARVNQDCLSASLKRNYDYIICGAGSAGCVVATRLVDSTGANILVLEAGRTDDLDITNDPNLWPATLGSELDWGFKAEANGLETFWHQCGTAKMGRDEMSVVDGKLKVYGIEGLRIADASVMPRVTSGNTMAPCVIIGEQAAKFMALST
jgi:choline dehydrogenase-like flavoprotein